MALTAEEQAELSALKGNKPSGGLSDDEAKELASLKSQQGPSWLDKEIPYTGGSTARGIAKSTLKSLPMAGMIGGGLLGNVPGAALGAAGGKALENLGESAMGEEKTRKDIYGGPLNSAKEGIMNEMGGQAIGKIGEMVAPYAGRAAAKLGSTLSGVPEKEITTYAKSAPEINAMNKASDYDTQDMADNLRDKINGKIKETRLGMNSQISSTLAKREGQTIESQPILDALGSAKGKINLKLRPEEGKEIDDLMSKVDAVSANGKIGLQDAHDLKEYLQEIGEGAYSKGGQMFQVGSKTARAAKSAAAMTRSAVNEEAPEVANANNTLSELRGIESLLNRNVLTPGKTASPLIAAGAGGNPANAKLLDKLGNTIKMNVSGDAEKLAAARTFGKPSLVPVDTTGKSLTRMGVAGLLGGIAGHAAGETFPGILIGEAASSPAAIKAAINTGRAASPLIKNPTVNGLVARGLINKYNSMAGQQ